MKLPDRFTGRSVAWSPDGRWIAAGGIEGVITTLVCREGTIPPTINFTDPDPTCDLDYAHDGVRERPVRLALTNSFGFGGHNVCLAIRRWDGA